MPTKKEFVAIAAILRAKLNSPISLETRDVLFDLIESVADHYNDCNDSFDRTRFYRACGIVKIVRK